jgi:hypothetical protein
MSGKIKKTSEEMSFSLSRWFRKMTTNAPTTTIVTIVGLAYAIFLFSGGLFTLINKPLPSYYTGSAFIFLYPDISNQFVSDTIISAVLYALGFAGMLAIYQSAKNASKPRQAYLLLVVGITFVLISYIFLEGAIKYKGG